MKATLTILALTMPLFALSQSDTKPPISVTIVVRNELSNRPVDAVMDWPDKTKVHKAGPGNYSVTLIPGQSEVLGISKDGYFDTNLKLDYDEEETTAYHEVKLKPGVPQLEITITSSET